MKAVVRLMLVYFTGTALLRTVSVLGLTAIVAGTAVLVYLPPLVGQVGLPSRFSLAEEALLMLVPVAGIIALLFGGALMPTMVSRLAGSHYAYVLPHARGKLLASAFGTVAFVALMASAAMYVTMNSKLPHVSFIYARLLLGSLLTYSTTYLVLWFVSRFRGPLAALGGATLVIGTLVLPLRFMGATVPLRWAIIPTVALWIVIAIALLLAPRLALLRANRRRPTWRMSAYAGGDELDLMIGTSRPWLLALGQIVPIVVAAKLIAWLYGDVATDIQVKVWLFYLVILSVLSAAAASFAATRSRALWLRAPWTRAELFARIEAAFWRRNCYTLGVLLVTMAAVGVYFELPNRALAFGIVLLGLATAVSTYLGLVVTRAIGWGVATLAVGGMLLLFMASINATDPRASMATIMLLNFTLAALAVALRSIAKRRWHDIDWMLARPETAVHAAA